MGPIRYARHVPGIVYTLSYLNPFVPPSAQVGEVRWCCASQAEIKLWQEKYADVLAKFKMCSFFEKFSLLLI